MDENKEQRVFWSISKIISLFGLVLFFQSLFFRQIFRFRKLFVFFLVSRKSEKRSNFSKISEIRCQSRVVSKKVCPWILSVCARREKYGRDWAAQHRVGGAKSETTNHSPAFGQFIHRERLFTPLTPPTTRSTLPGRLSTLFR